MYMTLGAQLSKCSSTQEVTVYIVTDAASALPSEAEWPAVWAAQQEFRAAL
jgi:hypothetical protein